eukprot:g1882.t1
MQTLRRCDMDQSILRIRKKFPNKLPCVVDFEGTKLKFIVPKDLSVAELMVHIRNQVVAKKLSKESRSSAFFLMRGATMMQGTMTMQEAVGGDDRAELTNDARQDTHMLNSIMQTAAQVPASQATDDSLDQLTTDVYECLDDWDTFAPEGPFQEIVHGMVLKAESGEE